MMQPFKIFTPSPILGYGYDLDEFWSAIEESRPAAIIIDGGSTDPGPYMLGTGKTICSRQSYVRDLSPMLEACARYNIKILISSAGGAGTNAQVDFIVDIIRELAESQHHTFKLATIKFDDDRELFKRKVVVAATCPCGPGPDLKVEDITNATTIVAQMGVEPFLTALDGDVDIIVAGRSYDPAPFAAFCISRGVQQAPAWHMGKIVECGGLCAVPKGRSMLATMYENSFELTPTDPLQRCTPLSVAAHTLYEKTRPDRLPGPGGVLRLDNATYTQLNDGRTVLVKGSVFVPSTIYQVKLEGAEQIGFRTSFIGGIRDPVLVRGIDKFLKSVRMATEKAFPDLGMTDSFQLIFHIYGKNAVMGPIEPSSAVPLEIGLLGEVVAPTQEDADAAAGFARVMVLHGAYEGQLATGGNLASPLTPLEQSAGPVFRFSIYHLVDIEEPTSLFPISKLTVGRKEPTDSKVRIDRPQIHRKGPAKPLVNVTTVKAAAMPAPTLEKNINSGCITIKDIAAVVRSKNSGPFEITLDILFDEAKYFHRVKASNALRPDVIKELYSLKDEDIITFMFYEPALGWKCTFKRPWPQGSVGERDTFGAQQHAPLLDIQIPWIRNAKL